MADKLIGIGPKGAIKKLLHDNGDGSYSDSVYMEGASISLEGDVVVPEMRALTSDDVVTAVVQGMDGITPTAMTVDSDGHLQVDVSDAVTISSDDLQYISTAIAEEGEALAAGVLMQGDDGTDRTNMAVDADGHLQVDVLSSPTSNGKVRVSKRVSFGASESGSTVWTPASGKKFVLTQIIVSAKTAGDVEFFDGTDSGNTVIGPTLSLLAGGGWSGAWTSDNPYRSAAADSVLKLTTGTGITGSVYVEGFEE
jgi:hypothetical protein